MFSGLKSRQGKKERRAGPIVVAPDIQKSDFPLTWIKPCNALRRFPKINVPIKSMDFFVWLGARRRHSELWQRRATTPDEERRDLIGMFIIGNRLSPEIS